MPVSVAIGPMYWDTFLYLDAAQRIAMGQIPNIDFSAPVGPLSYYLFAWGLELFPRAQPLLLAQWCLLVVAGPLMGVVLAELAPRHRGLAFALLVPFLVFAIAPSNVRVYHPFGGLEGVGLYNRHGVLLLYVLTSGLVFLKSGRKLVWFAALAMLALFLSKITAFLSGGLIGLVAVLAGRLTIRQVLLAAAIFAVPLAIAEVALGFLSGYVGDILLLVGLNEGSFLSRLLTIFSGKLDVILPAGIILVMLFWTAFWGEERGEAFFDRSFFWFGAALVAGTIYETQNTGSQEFIFLWPILLMIWGRLRRTDQRFKLTFLVLAAFCAVPTLSSVAHKSLRSVAAMITYDGLEAPLVRNMAQVAARPEVLDRAKLLLIHYPEFPETYADLAAHEHLPSGQYYSELDTQLFWILSVASASEGLLAFEAENGVRLETLMTLDFTNPFPWILGRDATRHIQIGAVAGRTLPPMSDEIRAAVEATDGVLRGKCPATPGRTALEETFAEALDGRTAVPLDPCWDLLIRPGLVGAMPAAQ
ncbi:hypothetical protein DMC47_16390 [Nostoc sp. 3335mG]|nr:hypothetical protein DMC47_16390 [Nostoc sp. 3335mG]